MKTVRRIYSLAIIVFIINFTNLILAQNSWTPTSLTSYVIDMKLNSSGDIFAVGDGAYRSTDNGQNWVSIASGLPQSSFPNLSIGIAPNNILFIGTFSNGVFRSTDNGGTWLKIDATMGNVTDFAFNNAGAIFAASTSGVYESTNDGVSWQQKCTYLTGYLAIDNKKGRIYATVYISTVDTTTVYVSTDNGNTWNPANNGLINGPYSFNIAVNSNGDIFAGTGGGYGIFRSTDGGNHWFPINDGIAYSANDFAFNASNQIFASSPGHVYLSTDNGDTWGQISRGVQVGCDMPSILSTGSSVFIAWWIETSSYTFGVSRRTDFRTALFPPIPYYPVNNSTNVEISTKLIWNSASLPTTYHVQVAGDSSFSKILFDIPDIVDTSTLVSSLNQGVKYYWHVNGNNAEGLSGWSHTWCFTTTYPPLIPPILLLPINGATVVSNNHSQSFSWGSVPSIAYSFQIALDSSFYSLVYRDSLVTSTSIVVPELQYNTKYYWRVRTIRSDSMSTWSLPWQFTIVQSENGIKQELYSMPNSFWLYQNYPNPFNPSTKIKFNIPTEAFVSLKVFDLLGIEVETLVNEKMLPGSYERVFDGNGLTGGVYFIRLQADKFIHSEKLLLLK